MNFLTKIATVAGVLIASAIAVPAMAVPLDYAPFGQTASIQGGGDAITVPAPPILDTSVWTFSSLDVTDATHEFQAADGSPTVVNTILLTTGAANNGAFFTLDFDRSTLAPPGVETGTLEFVITDTLSVSIIDAGFVQLVVLVFAIDVQDISVSAAYASPVSGVLTMTGEVVGDEVGITYSVVVPGAPNPTSVSEPIALAMLGVGLVGIGVVRRRR